LTKQEFTDAQKQSREQYKAIYRSVNRKLSNLYIDAAEETAEKIKTLETKKKGDSLTAASFKKLEATLRRTGAIIAGNTEELIIDVIDDSITQTNKPHLEYLKDAFKLSNTENIDFSILDEMYSQVNEDLINLTYTRVWQDGYNFSTRIWGDLDKKPGLAQRWVTDAKNVVTLGLAQGRDVLKIAQDLMIYSAQGKTKLMQRYGELVRGTAKFAKRIPKFVDWRALRIARSELYVSLQDASKIQGKLNPAVLMYIWNLTAGAVHKCICPDLAANSPYPENEIPDFPHSNCLCWISHQILSRTRFVDDLVDWGKGVSIPYLDNWYNQYYLPLLA
jgi:hypothetical protein